VLNTSWDKSFFLRVTKNVREVKKGKGQKSRKKKCKWGEEKKTGSGKG